MHCCVAVHSIRCKSCRMLCVLVQNDLLFKPLQIAAGLGHWAAMASSQRPSLPGPAVERIAFHLMASADRQTCLLSLLALAGVDRTTRQSVAQLPKLQLSYDSLSSVNRKTLSRRPLQRELDFSRASPRAKHLCFLSAARLFSGYTDVAFVGPIITDAVIIEVARRLQLDLRSVRVQARQLSIAHPGPVVAHPSY